MNLDAGNSFKYKYIVDFGQQPEESGTRGNLLRFYYYYGSNNIRPIITKTYVALNIIRALKCVINDDISFDGAIYESPNRFVLTVFSLLKPKTPFRQRRAFE